MNLVVRGESAFRRRREFFRITKYRRTYDRREGKFTINVSYETAAEITPRTTAVADAFGLGIDEEQKFVIYDNVEFKIGPKDIVYITGDSGSGKSVLLKEIKKDLGDEAVDMADIQLDLNRPLIETVGESVEEGLELLSRVGLNDAFLFLRKYSQLSDGQKYRYRLAKLLESGKQWWLMDEFCLKRMTLILTDDGLKSIENIHFGDKVLTHKGVFAAVNAVHKRAYNGQFVKILLWYRNIPIEVTEDHRFYIIKPDRSCKNAGLNFACRPNCRRRKDSCKQLFRKYRPNWIPAANIQKGDLVLLPLLNSNSQIVSIRLTDFVPNVVTKDGFAYYRSPINNSINRSSRLHRIPNEIKVNGELARLLGYYCAEGSQGPRFTFAADEDDLVEDVQHLMEKIFHIKPAYRKNNGSISFIQWNNKIVTLFFKKTCGENAKTKKAPAFLFNTKHEIILEFIKGWYRGDGCVSESTGSTISRTLAEGIFQLGLQVNILASVRRYKPGNVSRFQGRKITSNNPRFVIDLRTTDLSKARDPKIKHVKNYRHGFFRERYFCIFIRNVEHIQSQDEVFNLDVQRDSSYLTSHGLVHNCSTLDRDTAKIVAFNLQKIARKEGKAVYKTTSKDIG